MVDGLVSDTKSNRQKISGLIIPAIALGITTSIRVLGPLAGLMVFIYFVTRIIQQKKKRRLRVSVVNVHCLWFYCHHRHVDYVALSLGKPGCEISRSLKVNV